MDCQITFALIVLTSPIYHVNSVSMWYNVSSENITLLEHTADLSGFNPLATNRTASMWACEYPTKPCPSISMISPTSTQNMLISSSPGKCWGKWMAKGNEAVAITTTTSMSAIQGDSYILRQDECGLYVKQTLAGIMNTVDVGIRVCPLWYAQESPRSNGKGIQAFLHELIGWTCE